jgi:predicted ATPase
VEELTAVSSVELLVDRVRRATPAFDLNPGTAAVVAEVCRRLDGLPLALELAAGSWRVLGSRGVLDAISADPLDLHDLQGARPAAHSSLRSALAASHGLLAAETRHVLHGLSVFRGGWTIEAAAEVVGGGSLLDHLDRLAALGLVETNEDQPAGASRCCPRSRPSPPPRQTTPGSRTPWPFATPTSSTAGSQICRPT